MKGPFILRACDTILSLSHLKAPPKPQTQLLHFHRSEREGGERAPHTCARPFPNTRRTISMDFVVLCTRCPVKSYFKLPCVYTHVPVKRPTHIAVYTTPLPRSTPLKKTHVKPLQYSTNRVLFIPATASWRYWPWYWLMGEKARRNCKIHQGDLVITAPEAVTPRFLQGLEETPMSKTAGGPRLHEPRMRVLVWVASLSFMFWQQAVGCDGWRGFIHQRLMRAITERVCVPGGGPFFRWRTSWTWWLYFYRVWLRWSHKTMP